MEGATAFITAPMAVGRMLQSRSCLRRDEVIRYGKTLDGKQRVKGKACDRFAREDRPIPFVVCVSCAVCVVQFPVFFEPRGQGRA